MPTVTLLRKTWLGAVLAAAALAPATAQGAGWAPAVEPFGSTPTTAPPLLAANADGDLVVASGDGHVTTRPAGSAFTEPVRVPAVWDVAINKTGDVAVAWFADGAAHYAVRPHSGDFGPVRDLPSSDLSVDGVRIGLDDAGDVALAWMAPASAHRVLSYAVFAPDGIARSSGASDVAADAGAYFDLASDGAGDVVVAYSEQRGGTTTPVAAVHAARGAGFTAAPLGAPFSSTLMPRLDAAVDDAGHAAVAFESYAGDIEVHAASAPAGGAFTPEVVVSTPGVRSLRPTIAVGAGGDVAVTWTDPYAYAARARTGTFGQPFTAPITEFATGPGRPSVAVAPSGRTVATWSGYGTDGKDLFSAVREPGGSLVAQPAIGPGPSGSQALDQHWTPVAMDGDGDAFAAWREGDRTELAIDDVGAPRLRAVTIPEAGVIDHAVPLSATAVDGGSIPSIRWDFGDGTTGQGASVGHIYVKPGTYDVRVTATDQAGHAVSETRRIAIGLTPTDPGPVAPKPRRCKVPKLTGRSYASARARLTSAHCKMGRARKPKGHKTTKNLVVARQSRKAGAVTKAGAKVDVVLRVKKQPKRTAGHR
jgi:hypothetical protein